MIVWVGRKPFLDKNRAALVDFFEDTLRIVHWYLNPQHHQAAMEIFGNLTKQPPQIFNWVFTKGDTYHDSNMLPNLDALQKNVDLTTELGFVKSKYDIKNYVDLGIVKEAAARLEQNH
jgi:NitT/TauT family transport system substrate-binding protein